MTRNVLWSRTSVCVCLSTAACPHYCTTWMPPSYALLGGFAIGARLALLWQRNANHSYKLAFISDIAVFVLKRDVKLQPTNKLASTSRYDNIVPMRNVSESSVLTLCLVGCWISWLLPVSQVWHCLCCLPVTYTSVILSLLVYLLLLLLAFKQEIKVSQLGFSLFVLLCVMVSLVLLINVLFSCFQCLLPGLGLLCGWPDGLELVTWQCLWPDAFIWEFLAWFKNFFLQSSSIYDTLEALRLCAV